MKIKHKFFFLNMLILSFFVVLLPVYYISENAAIGIIRNYYYLASLLASVTLFIYFLRTIKSIKIDFLLLLFIFFGWILFVLVISISNHHIPWASSDVVNISFCFQVLVLGINLVKISNSRFFSGFIFVTWLVTSLLVISKVDPVYMQAAYGTEDQIFSGSYQYIGDIFAVVSMILISKVINSNKELKFKRSNFQHLTREEPEKRHFLTITLSIISLIILFLNGSRASLFSFIAVLLYVMYCLFKQLNPIKLILVSFLSLSLVFISLTFAYGASLSSVSFDFLLSNRNLEILSEGRSTSGEARTEYYELGIQDISHNPIIGNYVERNLYRGNGTYMHNILALIQDFGIFAFLSYLCLYIYCIKDFFRSWDKSQDYNSIVYNGILIFSIMQITFFRNPIGLDPSFICFGMTLRALSSGWSESRYTFCE